MDFLLKNGQIVTPEKTFQANLFLSNGKIAGIGIDENQLNKNVQVIDIQGNYILPGAIDVHVHLHLPTPAGFSADDFFTGTRAAIAGGTTSIIDFVTPQANQPLPEALEQRKREAESSLIDYGFHMSLVSWNKNTECEIRQCIDNEGITSFKTYLAYKNSIGIDDATFVKALQAVGQGGGLLTVHAEHHELIESLREKFIRSGSYSPEYHPLSRPADVEYEAVNRAITMAKYMNCPLYVVHVSAAESVARIAAAQHAGQPVFAETCPQYLIFDDSVYKKPFYEAAPFVMSPPIRPKGHQEKLWQALQNRTVQTFATDHCPFQLKGQKDIGIQDFTKIPNGATGIENRLEILHTFGVKTGRISINRMVELTASMPAQIFGLSHRKGAIKEGFDADIVVWNPDTKSQISKNTHHSNCDHNLYEGIETVGKAEMVFVGGKLAKKAGKLMLENLKGEYLFRKKY